MLVVDDSATMRMSLIKALNELGFDNGVGSKVQISVDWDSGRTLMLLDTDPFTTI